MNKIIIQVNNGQDYKEMKEIMGTMLANYEEWEKGKEKLKYTFGAAEIEASKVKLVFKINT